MEKENTDTSHDLTWENTDGERVHAQYASGKITLSGFGPLSGDIDTGHDITIEAPNGWRFHIAENGDPHLIKPGGEVVELRDGL